MILCDLSSGSSAMATTGVSSLRETHSRGFMVLLSAAVCEWILIFLLFVDAAFSYFLMKFAEYCELQTPCLFCSRIDPLCGKLKHDHYSSLLCRNHRDEISSLASCHVHRNLVDVRQMCEECFTPFSMHSSKLDSGSYKLLVGKLGLDIERQSVQSLLLRRKYLPSLSGRRMCPCCDKSWEAKPNAHRFLQLTPVGKANVKPPLPRVPGRNRFSRRESFKKLRNRLSLPAGPLPVGNPRGDTLSHVGYSELKYNSDSESEVPFSDDEDAFSAAEGRNDEKVEYDSHQPARRRHKLQKDDVTYRKKSHQASAHVSSLLDQHMQFDTGKTFSAHSLEELSREQTHPKPSNPDLAELVSLDDVTQAPAGASTGSCRPMESLRNMSNISMLGEIISFKSTPSSDVMEFKEDVFSVTSSDEENVTMSEQPTHASDFPKNGAPSKSEDINLTNAPGGVDDGKKTSYSSGEPPPPSVSGSTKVEDRKSVPQESAPDQDECQKGDASGSDGIHVQMLPSPERNCSSPEYLDGVSVSNVEGENATDMLGRQMDYDKKCMHDLYKELEEERNAASIAANQAMAMITRLQEEKAALHMEALQYLRMMEEQAEYDMEALQKANDLLSEKDKQLQDLEEELELYRNKIQEESVVMDAHKDPISSDRESIQPIEFSTGHDGFSLSESSPEESSKVSISKDTSDKAESSVTILDEEKLYLVEWLKRLERRIHEVPSIEACTDACNGGHPKVKAVKGDNQDDHPSDANDQACINKEVNGSPMQNDSSATNGVSARDGSTDVVQDCNVGYEDSHNRNNSEKLSASRSEISLTTLENEMKNFNDRLKALERDTDFVKHASSALRNGDDGLAFIQEIVHQLQELRRIELTRECISIP